MTTLYLDCNTGISGDMTVAALLDAGASREVLENVLKSIPAHGFRTEITTVKKNGIACCDFNVILDEDNHDHDMAYLFGEHTHEHHHHEHEHTHEHHHHHEHRHLSDILELIDHTEMAEGARTRAKRIFDILADAESKAHNTPKSEVHFHEVGALDSIVDIISAAVCLDDLKVTETYVANLSEGSGTIHCAHGELSIPVPAVANILCAYGIPVSIKNEHAELITPTGAAILASLDPIFERPACMKITQIGQGAGKRTYQTPSILRAMLIETNALSDTITKLECNIDDCTGENMGFLQELLFENGARDVTVIPCFMKKNRPAFLLQVICKKSDISTLESLIFKHSTTIGIRRIQMERTVLPRRTCEITTKWGNLRCKEVDLNGERRLYPEYEDVRSLSRKHGISFVEVMRSI